MRSTAALQEHDEICGLNEMVPVGRHEVHRVNDILESSCSVPARRAILIAPEIGDELAAQFVLICNDERMVGRRTELVDSLEQVFNDPALGLSAWAVPGSQSRDSHAAKHNRATAIGNGTKRLAVETDPDPRLQPSKRTLPSEELVAVQLGLLGDPVVTRRVGCDSAKRTMSIVDTSVIDENGDHPVLGRVEGLVDVGKVHPSKVSVASEDTTTPDRLGSTATLELMQNTLFDSLASGRVYRHDEDAFELPDGWPGRPFNMGEERPRRRGSLR